MIYERQTYSIYCDLCNKREDISIIGSFKKAVDAFTSMGWKQKTVYGSVRDFCSDDCLNRQTSFER